MDKVIHDSEYLAWLGAVGVTMCVCLSFRPSGTKSIFIILFQGLRYL